MLFSHHDEACLRSRLGDDGIDPRWLETEAERLAPTLSELKQRTRRESAALLNIAGQTHDLNAITAHAAQLRAGFRNLVVVGAGGSSLSGQIMRAFAHLHVAPPIYFLDNIDPDSIDALLARVFLPQTHFVVISKSGSTVETLAQLCVLIDAVRDATSATALGKHFTVLCGREMSPMRACAQEHGMTLLDHADDIGGRFSALTNVGLLPAALLGLDIAALRRGAKQVVDALDASTRVLDCPSARGALLQYGFMQKGRNITVMLPYSDRLAGFSSWYRQSWSESLGKSGFGSTPIRAVGTTDQHSQLQLYLDGPKDKLFHLITVARRSRGQTVRVTGEGAFSYLDGKTTGDIMQAQQGATYQALLNNRCPVRHFALEQLSEESLAALIMHFTLEIIFMGALLGVNPFDQPAVEESKRLAREQMGAL